MANKSGKIAVFVDAGYFHAQVERAVLNCENDKMKQHRLGRESVSIDYTAMRQAFLDFVETEFPDSSLLRVYWFDAPAYSNNTKNAGQLAIEELDDFKLRLGSMNSQGQQKEVDGLILVDVIQLAMNKSISEALFVSGDADLAPGMIMAQSQGVRVHLLSIRDHNATSPILKREADRKRLWTKEAIDAFAKPADWALERLCAEKAPAENQTPRQLAGVEPQGFVTGIAQTTGSFAPSAALSGAGSESAAAALSQEKSAIEKCAKSDGDVARRALESAAAASRAGTGASTGEAMAEGCPQALEQVCLAARKVVESLGWEQIQALSSSKRELPPEVDRRTLSSGGAAVGRRLVEKEKIAGRNEALEHAKRLVEKQTSGENASGATSGGSEAEETALAVNESGLAAE